MLFSPQLVAVRRPPIVAAGLGLQTSLAAFYELSEASGTRADSTANAFTLTNNNTVTQTTGIGGSGNASQFTSASSQSLSHANAAGLQVGGVDFSVAGWVYFDTINGAAIASKYAAFGNREFVINTGFTGTNQIRFQLLTNSGSTSGAIFAGALSTATWYFFCATYVTATAAMTVSVNAGTRATATAINPPVASSTAQLILGSDDNTHENGYHNGRIQRLGLWKGRALSAGDEALLYNSGAGLSFAAMA